MSSGKTAAFAIPILSKIQGIVQPIQPVLDLLEKPLPVLSDLAGSPVTLLDVAKALGVADTTFIDAAIKIIDLTFSPTALRDTRRLTVLENLNHPHLIPIIAARLKDAHGRELDLGQSGDDHV